MKIETRASEGFELRGFSPTVGLEALAELSADFEALAQSGVRGRIRTSALGSEPLFFVPGDIAKSGGRERPPGDLEAAYRRLLHILEARAPHFERQESARDESWWRLDQTLPLFLLESGRDDEAAHPEEGELLLIDHSGDAERIAKLCDDLRFHATHCRLAATTAADGGERFLIHLLADPERKPSLGGLTAAGALDALDRLAAFRCGERTVFLGGERTPSQRALEAFCDLLAALIASEGPPAERLVAVLPRDGEAGVGVEIYPLAGLDFLDQAAFTPSPGGYTEVEILSLTASASELQRLRERILAAPPTVGHHLELRSGYPAEGLDRELEHLAGKLAELEQRRAYLENLRRPRPVLMRFAPHQLPALADAIRSFPTLEVRDGKILYGFEATEENPGGWHFLLFQPGEANPAEAAPPWRFRELEDRLDGAASVQNETTRFWLEPLWANDYQEAGECLVFVPRGSILFPSLHSWHPEEMDAYLRELLVQWFPGERGLAQVPRRALYLFDEIRDKGEKRGKIRVQVLDRGAFRPLTEQIGWLNDNLTLEHALGGVREWITQLAERENRRRLASDLKHRARAAQVSFEKAASEANLEIAAGATELLEAITGEIARIAERCRVAAEEIPRLHAHLEASTSALSTLSRMHTRTGDAISSTVQSVGENLQWVRALEEELTRLELERHQVEIRVKAAIEDLERRYAALRQRMRS